MNILIEEFGSSIIVGIMWMPIIVTYINIFDLISTGL